MVMPPGPWSVELVADTVLAVDEELDDEPEEESELEYASRLPDASIDTLSV
jgi:hypothetical protein